MGTWGTALFSDDTACDVREDFRDAIADGVAPSAATDKILADYAPDPADPPYAATVWLALAVTQWKLGRLEERVRDAALAAIDGGGALVAWLGTKSEARRRQILADTRALLLSAPPPPQKVRRTLPCTCEWQPGDLVAYRTVGGNQIILQIQMLHTDKGGTYPSLEVLDWQGADLPALEMIDALPFARATPEYIASLHRSFANPDSGVRMSRIMLLGLKAHTMKGRFRALGHRRTPPESRWPQSGNAVLLRNFDDYLGRVFGIR
jgi:hypothetical protein